MAAGLPASTRPATANAAVAALVLAPKLFANVAAAPVRPLGAVALASLML